MAAVTLNSETIIVDQVGPYGVKANGQWYGVNKPLTPQSFTAGQKYTIQYKQSGTKRYIASYSQDFVPSAFVPETTNTMSTVTVSGTLKRSDEVGERIKRQGSIQAALQSPGLVAFSKDANEYWKLVEDFANRAIEFIEQK